MDIINTKKLNSLYGEADIAQDIIHMFIDKSPELIEMIEKALLTNNQSHLEQICHKGIGQARYIASPLIEQTLLSIQNTPEKHKESHLAELKSIIQQLKNEYT